MQPSQLPCWVQYVWALGPSFVAIVAALIAGYIALRQWLTARHRLKLDIFDKRFAVYEATKMLITKRPIRPHDLGEFYNGTRGAEFLFDGDTRTFLMNLGDIAFKARMKRYELDLE